RSDGRMRTEVRFLLAIGLMLLVLVGTNILFPPIPPEPPTPGEEAAEPAPPTDAPVLVPPTVPGEADPLAPPGEALEPAELAPPPPRTVVVETPLYRWEMANYGASLLSVELPAHRSLREEGPVQLVPEGATALTSRVVVGTDTLDL